VSDRLDGLHPHEPLVQERRTGLGVRKLQQDQIVRIKIEAVWLDSTAVKVHPDGTGVLKRLTANHRQVARRMDYQDSYGCRGCSNGVDVCASPGQAHDAPEGCKLLRLFGKAPWPVHFLIETRQFWIWASSLTFLRRKIELGPGSTTARCKSDTTRSNSCSVDSRDFGASFRDSKISMSCSLRSSTSHSSPMA